MIAVSWPATRRIWSLAAIVFVGCSAKEIKLSSVRGFVGPPLNFPPHSAATVQQDASNPTLSCGVLKGLPWHVNTQQAFQNLHVSAEDSLQGFMVGVGTPGRLLTGPCNTVQCSINSKDVDDWKSNANLIGGKFSHLILLGCSVGQYQDGADLAMSMAKEINSIVRAPAGLVWCQAGSLIVEPDTPWLEAKPGEKVKAIDGRPYTVPPETQYRLFLKGELREVSVDAVHVDSFQFLVPMNNNGAGRGSSDVAKRLVERIDFARPFIRDGRPLAITTGVIQLSVAIDGEHIAVKRYSLYADSIVEDTDASGVFYPVDTRLHAELQTLRLH